MNPSMDQFLPYKVIDINDPSILPNLEAINESPEIRAKSLEILRTELKNLEDIEPCLEEYFLLRFLRLSKFDTSKACQRMLKYYQQQEKLLDAFKNLSLPLHKARSLKHGYGSPYRLKNNTVLLFGLAGKVDYSKFTNAERFYMDLLAINNILDNPLTQIAGVTAIFDLKGFNYRSFLAYTPNVMMLYIQTFIYAFPTRVKAFHIVNAPNLFWAAFKIIYPFLTKKMQERVFMHADDDWESLHAEIPPEILPEEYGGKLKFDSCINYLENIEELEYKFHKLYNYGYIKTKASRRSFRPICRKN